MQRMAPGGREGRHEERLLHGNTRAHGEQVTIIDIRALELYREGHIPGAINMPATIISKKKLPPLGTVVVYGDGIRTDLTNGAAEALNAMSGIEAVMLDGGFSAWESLNL